MNCKMRKLKLGKKTEPFDQTLYHRQAKHLRLDQICYYFKKYPLFLTVIYDS